MRTVDGPEFTALLASVFDAYSKPVPMDGTQALWWNVLAEFDLMSVRNAMGRYVATQPKFPPTPAEIREMLGADKGDARPGADEAWAIALASRDENETVVWTTETAEAFGSCRPVLDIGDEVGARMAFKDAYGRICGAAKLRGVAPVWVASVGFDKSRREAVLQKAASAGLLPAPHVAALLPPPAEVLKPTEAAAARAQLDRIRQMLAEGAKRNAAPTGPTFDAVRTEALKEAADQRVKEFAHGTR